MDMWPGRREALELARTNLLWGLLDAIPFFQVDKAPVVGVDNKLVSPE